MSETHDTILKAALELPEEERFSLAEKLFASVPEGPELWDIDDPGFLDELRRRSNDGQPTIPWSEVRKELLSDNGL